MTCPVLSPLWKRRPRDIERLEPSVCFRSAGLVTAYPLYLFVVQNHPLLAAGQEYRVFFDVRHAKVAHTVLLFVQSAYPANPEKGSPHGARRKKVGFRVLVNHALGNTKPSPPP